MVDLQALHRRVAQISQDMGVSFRKLRFGTTELSVNPRIKDEGESPKPGGPREGRQRFFQYYEAFIDLSVFADSGIPESAIAIGQSWQMADRAGTTWIDLFINSAPVEQATRYRVEFARYLTDANLTVNYEVGRGTFTSTEGNPVEDVDPAQITALVSQRQRPTTIELPGIPSSALYLEGFLRAPATLPAECPTNDRLDATITNGTGQSITGSFLILPSAQPPLDVDSAKGELIRGFLILDGNDRG